MKVPEQVTRLATVAAVLLAAVLAVRFVILPASYFSTTLHQASTVERETAKPIRFAGTAVCADCHGDKFEAYGKGYHKGLNCETCHGPAVEHTEDPLSTKPDAPRDRRLCVECHAYDPARPTGFPQINPTAHNPVKPCIACHDPHDPVPPEVPKECSACHAQIERTKALSRHALLACTTCHTVSERHRVAPRSAPPTKPDSRDFCGRCHALDARNPDTPKVDFAAHGGRYLCWQCHYPHLPEGRQ